MHTVNTSKIPSQDYVPEHVVNTSKIDSLLPWAPAQKVNIASKLGFSEISLKIADVKKIAKQSTKKQYVPNHLKAQEMYAELLYIEPYSLEFVSNLFKTQKISAILEYQNMFLISIRATSCALEQLKKTRASYAMFLITYVET